MLLRLCIVAGMLCAAGAGAQKRGEPVPPPTDRSDAGSALSKEDAELVKDLAVLERMELLRNLDLFEEPKEPEKGEQRPK